MKTSIRSKKFTIGMVLFLVIILLLSVSSGYYLNSLSSKTSAILNENHYSVVYARDMSENLIKINQGIINSFISNKTEDALSIDKASQLFSKSLNLEKNNITETGEDTLAGNIENCFKDYYNTVLLLRKSKGSPTEIVNLQMKFDKLHLRLMLLSKMNEKAIVEKTNDAKVSAKKSTLQMSFIATICFLIAYGYTFIFSSYFNDRFYKLYNGVNEMVSSNYRQKLQLNGNDEISEISVIINEMAEKISKVENDVIVSID